MRRIMLSVEECDVFQIPCDILALKYAQAHFGVDAMIVKELLKKSPEILDILPQPGKSIVLEASPSAAAAKLIFVGVKPLRDFNYGEIRDFSRQVLTDAAFKVPQAAHVVFTLHGAGYGLDETEAFESEIAGIIDALENGVFPTALERISIVEIRADRVKRLKQSLRELVPTGFVEIAGEVNISPELPVTDVLHDLDIVPLESDATKRLRNAGYRTEMKPHLFVAMPFAPEMEDFYDYGIHGAARSAGFVCERADYSSYTGDVLAWVKDRINKATMVVADLTGANPNVYLEVGYAWGIGKKTVLIVRDEKDLRFDVRGQKCLIYNRIKDLEEKLKKELAALKSEELD